MDDNIYFSLPKGRSGIRKAKQLAKEKKEIDGLNFKDIAKRDFKERTKLQGKKEVDKLRLLSVKRQMGRDEKKPTKLTGIEALLQDADIDKLKKRAERQLMTPQEVAKELEEQRLNLETKLQNLGAIKKVKKEREGGISSKSLGLDELRKTAKSLGQSGAGNRLKVLGPIRYAQSLAGEKLDRPPIYDLEDAEEEEIPAKLTKSQKKLLKKQRELEKQELEEEIPVKLTKKKQKKSNIFENLDVEDGGVPAYVPLGVPIADAGLAENIDLDDIDKAFDEAVKKKESEPERLKREKQQQKLAEVLDADEKKVVDDTVKVLVDAGVPVAEAKAEAKEAVLEIKEKVEEPVEAPNADYEKYEKGLTNDAIDHFLTKQVFSKKEQSEFIAKVNNDKKFAEEIRMQYLLGDTSAQAPAQAQAPAPAFTTNTAFNAYNAIPDTGALSKEQKKVSGFKAVKEVSEFLGIPKPKGKESTERYIQAIQKYKQKESAPAPAPEPAPASAPTGKGFKFTNIHPKVLGGMIHNKILANRLKRVHPALLGGALAHDLIHRQCNYHMKKNPKLYTKIKKEADKHLIRLNKLHGGGWFSNIVSKAVSAGKSISTMAQSAKAKIQPMIAKIKPYIDQGIAIAKEQAPKLAKAGLKQAVSMGLNFVPMGATIQSAISPHIDKLIDKGVDMLTAKLLNSPPKTS